MDYKSQISCEVFRFYWVVSVFLIYFLWIVIRGASLRCCWLLNLNHLQTLTESIFLFRSPPGRSHWERLHGRPDAQDHRFRLGERVAQNYQNEHGGHLRLDGPRSYQVLHVFKRKRRLEVSAGRRVDTGTLFILIVATPFGQQSCLPGLQTFWGHYVRSCFLGVYEKPIHAIHSVFRCIEGTPFSESASCFIFYFSLPNRLSAVSISQRHLLQPSVFYPQQKPTWAHLQQSPRAQDLDSVKKKKKKNSKKRASAGGWQGRHVRGDDDRLGASRQARFLRTHSVWKL